MPLVSVLMPVYNAEKYLREAIDSILAQTFSDFEFIIIDDGSTDSSVEIINSYNDGRIRFYKNEKNMGVARTLNKGLRYATGKYIARMDSDDIAVLYRLERQIDFLETHPNILVLGSSILVFGEGIIERLYPYTSNPQKAKAELLFNSSIAHPTVMMRKDVLLEHSLEYEGVYEGLEDYVLWWRIAKYGEIASIEEPLLKYRKHITQATKNRSKDFEGKLYEFLLERISVFNINIDDRHKQLFFKYCIEANSTYVYDDVLEFIRFFKQLVIQNKKKECFNSKALRLEIGLALSRITFETDVNLLKKNLLLFWACFNCVMPFALMLKVLLYRLLKG